MPFFLNDCSTDAGHVVVAAGEDLGQRLEDGDRGAHVGEGRGELAPDGAAADDDRRRGTCAESRNSSEVTTVRPSGSKPGMVRGTDPLARITASPVIWRDSPSAPDDATMRSAAERAGAVEDGDLAALEQAREAAGQLVDRPSACGRCVTAQSTDWARRSTPKSAACWTVRHDGRGLEQLLGRDAATVQAGAADLVLLDHGDVQPGASPRRARRRTRPDHLRSRRGRSAGSSVLVSWLTPSQPTATAATRAPHAPDRCPAVRIR